MKIQDIWEYFGVDGWFRQGVQMEIEGHDVQIIRFDRDDDEIILKIDNKIEYVDWGDVPEKIYKRL